MNNLLTLEGYKAGETTGKVVKFFEPECKSTKDKDGLFWITMTTESIDLAGDVIEMDGWDTDHWEKKNPVILWSHQDPMPNIGRGVKFQKLKRSMRTGIEFIPKEINPFAGMVGEMAHGGWLRMGSVGFHASKAEPIKNKDGEWTGLRFQQQKLLEFSLCNIGCNPDALAGAKAAGIDINPMNKWAEQILDQSGDILIVKGLDRAVIEKVHKMSNPEDKTTFLMGSLSRVDELASEFEKSITAAKERIDALADEYADVVGHCDCSKAYETPVTEEATEEPQAADIVALAIKRLVSTTGKDI